MPIDPNLAIFREAVRYDDAKAVCTYCGERSHGYLAAEPANNGSGNWIHRSEDHPDWASSKLCVATAIHNRIAFEKGDQQ